MSRGELLANTRWVHQEIKIWKERQKKHLQSKCLAHTLWRSSCFIHLSGTDMTKWDVPFGNVLLQQSLIITLLKVNQCRSGFSLSLTCGGGGCCGDQSPNEPVLVWRRPVMDTEHTDTCEGSDVMPWWYWAFTPSHWAKYIIICVVLCYSIILFILMYKHSSWSFVVCKRFISPVFMTL